MIDRRSRSRIVLHLSKPWEMGEALGWEALPAMVCHRDRERWLVELEEPFQFRGIEYRYIVVSPRLPGWGLDDAEMLEVPCLFTAVSPARALGERPCDVRECDAAAEDAMTGSVTDFRCQPAPRLRPLPERRAHGGAPSLGA